MKEYPAKEIIRNILAVAIGVLIGFVLFWLGTNLLLMLLPSYIYANSASTENKNFYQLFVSGVVLIGCIMAGYITAKISTRNTFIHVLITGIILFVIMAGTANFDWKGFNNTAWITLLLTIPCTMLGGLKLIRKKNQALR